MTDTKIAEKTENTEKTDGADKAKLFNLPQIAGGALAAVTTAVIGSRLGVAGTLAGAAVASVLAAVASTLYTKGLERTRDGVKRIVLRDADGKTEVLMVPDVGGPESSVQQLGVSTSGIAASTRAKRSKWRSPWALGGGMAATAAVTFVVAMGMVTGWEFTSGQSLDGNRRTTIGQVNEPQSSTKPTPAASASTSAPASDQPSATPTATPTPTTPVPTPTPTTATTPSAAPTADPSENVQPSQ